MQVVQMIAQIGFIVQQVFPITMLPQAAAVFCRAALGLKFRGKEKSALPGNVGFDQAPAGGEIGIVRR